MNKVVMCYKVRFKNKVKEKGIAYKASHLIDHKYMWTFFALFKTFLTLDVGHLEHENLICEHQISSKMSLALIGYQYTNRAS